MTSMNLSRDGKTSHGELQLGKFMSLVKGSNATSDHNKPPMTEGVVSPQTEILKFTMKVLQFLLAGC